MVSVPMGLPLASVSVAVAPGRKLSCTPSPLVSMVKPVTLRVSFSGSVSLLSTLPVAGVSSTTALTSLMASGTSFTGAIFKVTKALSVPPWPSVMVYSNFSSPL